MAKKITEEIKTPEFGQLPFNLICRSGELTKYEFRVLCVLYAAQNQETKRCNIRRRKIAEWMPIDRANLSRAVAGLEEKGWLVELENKEFMLVKNPPPVKEKSCGINNKNESEKVVDSTTTCPEKVVESTTEKPRKVVESTTKKDANLLLIPQQVVVESTTKINKDLNIKRTYKTKTLSEQSSDVCDAFDFKVDVGAFEVFVFWQEKFNRQKSRYDEKRQKIIVRAREKWKFSIDELKTAIKGVLLSDWHLGANPTRTKYVDFKTIFKDSEQIEKFRDMADEAEINAAPTAPGDVPDQESAYREMMKSKRTVAQTAAVR